MATHSIGVLKALKEIAAKETDLAAEALAEAIKASDEAHRKLDVLSGYRQDYVDNLNNLMESGMSAEVYRNFQSFLKKLDQAVAGQQEVIAFINRQVSVQRALWQECQRKKLSYDVLSQRSDKREYKVQQKLDQKNMDEFAMRASRGKHLKSAVVNSRS
jgi:flagellar protein FliJ